MSFSNSKFVRNFLTVLDNNLTIYDRNSQYTDSISYGGGIFIQIKESSIELYEISLKNIEFIENVAAAGGGLSIINAKSI